MQIKSEHSKLFFYALVFGFFLLLIYSIFIYSNQVFAEELNTQPEVLEKNSQINVNTPEQIIQEKILAESYVIYDVNAKKIIRSQNASTPLPIASLTKVITVGTLLDTAKKNNIQIREETKYRIQKALIQSSNEDADSLGYIYQYSFGKDLLAESNNLVTQLGINNLHLTNLTGLDNWDGTASNIGSAESIARIFAYMYENYRDVFEFTKFDELNLGWDIIENTNHSINSTFGVLASKTGYTFTAGGNLAVIVSPEPGRTFVIVVLHSTKEGRFADMQKLVKNLPLILKESN
jgi:D-alanyl-D-alanine carboxypeptidase